MQGRVSGQQTPGGRALTDEEKADITASRQELIDDLKD
jgi:hypothetical protein